MPKTRKTKRSSKNDSTATVGCEAQLWQTADALRGSMDDSDWRGELLSDDKRWKYGTPPAGCSQCSLGSV